LPLEVIWIEEQSILGAKDQQNCATSVVPDDLLVSARR